PQDAVDQEPAVALLREARVQVTAGEHERPARLADAGRPLVGPGDDRGITRLLAGRRLRRGGPQQRRDALHPGGEPELVEPAVVDLERGNTAEDWVVRERPELGDPVRPGSGPLLPRGPGQASQPVAE